MTLGLVLSIVFGMISIILLLRFVFVRKKVRELRIKTDFSVKSDDLMKISFEGDRDLGGIAGNFNSLVNKYQGVKVEHSSLKADQQEKKRLDGKVKEFEESLSQVNLLTEIGKKITASLNVEEIVNIVYEYVKSAMDVEELELLYFTNEQPIHMSITKKHPLKYHSGVEVKDGAMNWSLENNREVFLNNAEEDYAQYLFKPITSFSGTHPGAVICLPLLLNEKRIGAVGVSSTHKNVYNQYHLEFLKTLASYLSVALDNSNVYQLLDSGKKQIEAEKLKSDALLLNILPAEVAEELKEKGQAKAKSFKNVTVMFTDFVNFTGISESLSPEELVAEIDLCFKAFDAIIEKNNMEKIKTIGDAYLAVCGLPNEDPNHATNSINAALDIIDFMKEREKNASAKIKSIRIGLNSGPVVAGIVGVKKFAYDIWGDTVNTAARMEQQSQTGKINISGATFGLSKDQFNCTHRGKIEAKNKGEIDMYFVDSQKAQ